MDLHFLKTFWRSIRKGQLHTLVNLFGLSLGIAGSLVILLWIRFETSYDSFHPRSQDIYEVYGQSGSLTDPAVIEYSAPALGPFLKAHFPKIESLARYQPVQGFLLTAKQRGFTHVQGAFADPSFLEIFRFTGVEGPSRVDLSDPNGMVITQGLAEKLFGKGPYLGQMIRLDSVDHFRITAVLANLPGNTRFDFEYLLPWSYHQKLEDPASRGEENWLSNNTQTFVRVVPGPNQAKVLSGQIKDVSRRQTGRTTLWTHWLFPLRQWHLYSRFENGVPRGGRIDTIRLFGGMALFILLIACINFINLSTALSERRAKEIGVRKAAGASRGNLMAQFLGEAVALAAIASMLSILLAWACLPFFNDLMGLSLTLPMQRAGFWLGVAGLALLTGLLAGIYPSWYLSSFKPVSIFKKAFRNPRGGASARQVLVVFQYVISTVLVMATLTIRQQIRHGLDRESGMDRSRLLEVDLLGDLDKNASLVRQELLGLGIASSVSRTMQGIVYGGARSWGWRWPQEDLRDTDLAVLMYSGDQDLVRTLGLHVLEGRDLQVDRLASDSFSVLLNESAVRRMRLEKPVGTQLRLSGISKPYTVVGVVRDFVFGDPYRAVQPTIIGGPGPGFWFTAMDIRLNTAGALPDQIRKMEAVFAKYNPDYPFEYRFVDDAYRRLFEGEQHTGVLVACFAGLAIFVSCMGLFGLATFMAQSRQKEIGVRKVLGASSVRIVLLLTRNFLQWVGIAVLVALPLGWWAMDHWLRDYDYRIQIGWSICLGSAGLSLLIALVATGQQSIWAANRNPTSNLRTE